MHDHRGNKNPRWCHEIGDTWIKGMYMMIKDLDGKRKPLHRYLMEQKMGRNLMKGEFVHHIDGDTFNNDINNLRVVSHAKHNKIHFNGREPWNKGLTNCYSEATLKKMSEAKIGTTFSIEHRENISVALKGRPSSRKGITMTEEQKKKISISMIEARKNKFWSTSGEKI